MTRCLFLLTLLFACPALAQTYVPFPPDFETLSAADKDAASRAIDSNSEIYFRSRDYGQALNAFVRAQNPQGINECKDVKMATAGNGIHVVEPLLFEQADDRHPLVGKWEQSAAFDGCGRHYSFTIVFTAAKAGVPDMSIRQ